MAPRLSSAMLVAALVLTLGIRHSSVAHAAAPAQCLPAVRVTASVADESKTAYKSLHDGNISTFLNSSAKGWQYVQFDFGCEVDLYELRRYMTRDGRRIDGVRAGLGEAVVYSRDGVSWSEMTNDTSKGWETAKVIEADPDGGIASGYRGFAWHSLPYGWSPSLSLTKSARARFVRYNWDVYGDRLHELKLTYGTVNASFPVEWNLATWDWTRDQLLTVHYTDDLRTLPPPDRPVILPWNEHDGPCYQENPDIAPSNGWVMLTGNLGTPFRALPDYPYFVLYNRYTGTMRWYFFYGPRTGQNNDATHQMGTLAVADGEVAAFTHHTGKTAPDVGEPRDPQSDYDPLYQQIFLKKGLAVRHWTCLEFDASGYDPNIGDTSKTGANFIMTFDGLERTEVDAVVAGGLSGVLDFSDLRTGRDMSGLDAITTGAGSFLKVVNVYKDIDDTLNQMETKGAANPMTWWGPLLQQAAALASQNTVPLIGAAAGFITSLIDGGETKVPLSYRVNLTGEFRLTGTLQTSRWVANPRVYVPGTIYGRTPEMRPLYHEPLGVYSLTREPVIEWYDAPSAEAAKQWGGTRGVTLWFDPSSVSVNPHAGLRLHSIAVAPVSSLGSQPIPFKDPTAYTGTPETWMTTSRMNSLKVGVRLQFERLDDPTAPLVTFYREYPAVFQHLGVWGL
jgi:hypothetical protein